MKISELIKHLEFQLEHNGDVRVFTEEKSQEHGWAEDGDWELDFIEKGLISNEIVLILRLGED